MDKLTTIKFFIGVLLFSSFHEVANATCGSSNATVTVEIDTDTYGYELYWELVPSGNSCGSGTLFSGGNNLVGCNGGGLQNQNPGGYANNATITEGTFELTVGSNFDIKYVDDYGDGGATFRIYQDGVLTNTFVGSGSGSTHTFTGATPPSCPKAPGNVTGNLAMYLQTTSNVYQDAGITLASNGSTVQQWNDQGNNANHLSQSSSSNRPTFRDNTSNYINYNPVIEFINESGNSNDDYLNFSNAATGDFDVYMVIQSTQTTSNTSFWAQPLLYGGDQNESGKADVAITIGTTGALHIGGGRSGDYDIDGTTSINTGEAMLIQVSRDAISASNTDFRWRISGGENGYSNATQSNNGTAMSDNIRLGLHSNGESQAFDGFIGEMATYSSVLSSSDRAKVESHLSLKFGISLDQNTPQDFVLSDGTAIWDASVVGTTYDHDITGIARDDNSELNQKQSRSASSDAMIMIGLAEISSSNSTNSNSFPSDKQSLMWANNNASATSWSTSEKPIALNGRINREWNVEENNGDVGTVKISIPASTLPATSDYVYLLIDSDGDFSAGASTLTLTLTGGNYETTLNFTDGTFFTVGYATGALPVELVLFTVEEIAEEIQISWSTATETNNDRFEIKRSIDLIHWEIIAIVQGQGNSSSQHQYKVYDDFIRNEIVYYSLDQFDYDGTVTNYAPIKFSSKLRSNQFIIYPNPSHGLVKISLTDNFEGDVEVEIFNSIGKRIYQNVERFSSTDLSLDVQHFQTGSYLLRVIRGNNSWTSKLIIH